MTRDTVCVVVALNERGTAVEWVTTLGAEEVADMPFRSSCNNDLTLDRCFAGTAAGRKELVEVQVAVEAERIIGCFGRCEFEAHALQACEAFLVGFRVERDAFEWRGAVVTCKAFRVEAGFKASLAGTGGGDDSARYGERTA
jgi:hypothetical protein